MMLRFLLVRRTIDPVLLSIGGASLVVKLGPEILIFGLFACFGGYLILFNHRSTRYIDRTYAISAGLYAAGAVIIGLMHGPLLEEIRWIGYPVFLLLGVLLVPGIALVRDPLRQLVLGVRAGLVLAVAMGSIDIVSGMARTGFGSNPANAAFILVVVGIMARIPVRDPVRFLPNSRLWFYVATITVIMTGTRSVLPVFLVALALDMFEVRRRMLGGAMHLTLRSAAVVGLVGLIGFSTLGQELSGPITARVDDTVGELTAAIESDAHRMDGLQIRFVLWQKAIDLIREKPLIGAGGADSMQEIKQAIPAEERGTFRHFNHVHQFVLDEMRQRGAIGLVLMLGFFIATTGKLLARGSPPIREAVVLFIASLLLFGSMHGLLLADRNMALIAIFLSMLLLHLKKEAIRAGAHGAAQRSAYVMRRK